MSEIETHFDVDTLWEYGDPVKSERRFRAALDAAAGGGRLEVLTQLARSLGLQRRFVDAHALLDEVERELGAARDHRGDTPVEVMTPVTRLRVRLLLERGRVFNSSGDRDRARALFTEAWELARHAIPGTREPTSASPLRLDGLAVDAAHMIAITLGGNAGAIEWNRRGLELARQSADAKARALIPAMLNNLAWDLHALHRFGEALSAFHDALKAWTERGREKQIRIAKWSVARCQRSLSQHEEALEALRSLEAELAEAGTCDGFVFEEIAENLEAIGEVDAARPYFRRASEELAKDAWFVANESSRLARLQERGAGAATD